MSLHNLHTLHTLRHLLFCLPLLLSCRNELPIGELLDGGASADAGVPNPGTDGCTQAGGTCLCAGTQPGYHQAPPNLRYACAAGPAGSGACGGECFFPDVDAGRAEAPSTVGLDCSSTNAAFVQQAWNWVAVSNGIGRSGGNARFETGFCPGTVYKSFCRQTIGACEVIVREVSPDQPGAPCNIMNHSAGTITVSGGTHPVTLVPAYDYQESPMSLWNGGETLRFDATGGDIPAFSGTLVAPNRITLTNVLAVVDRSRDLVLAWTGGGSGQLSLNASVKTGPMSDVVLTCQLAASAGRGTIAAELLSRFPAGVEGAVSVGVRETAPAHAGAVEVSVLASDLVLGSDGQLLPASLTFK